MDNNTKITLIKKLNTTDMAGDKVMIDFETGKYFLLKGTASDIWDCIQEDNTIGNIISHLLNLYDVNEATCRQGVESFLLQLERNGFITIS